METNYLITRTVKDYPCCKNGDELPNARLISQAIMDEYLDHLYKVIESGIIRQNNMFVSLSRDFCFPLQIPENDPELPPGCLNFVRAKGVMDNNGVRQQINLATAFVDASVVYGSTPELNKLLRVPGSFLLKTDDNLLPTPAGVNNCFNPVKPKKCPVAVLTIADD
ncbi:PXDN [Mytilus edulis]|uniref:PXDN n=1 Tax=Mytilus edulis TaxID=6550 RepID=A0A8S3SYC6_MYTED|nr:PXDN [Mytilus edulis]